MQKSLLIAAVLLAACSPVKTITPEADCLALELAQVGEFWGPALGCERVATVPPLGGSTFLQVAPPKLRPGYFVFYELVWQVGLSGNRAQVDINLFWENPWVEPDPIYPGRVTALGANYWTGGTDLVDAGSGRSSVRVEIKSDAYTPDPFTFFLTSVKPVYVPATQIGAFTKRTGLTVHNISTTNLPPARARRSIGVRRPEGKSYGVYGGHIPIP